MNYLILDLETTGLLEDLDRILVGGFKLNDEPIYVEKPPFSAATKRLLSDSETAIVGHNVLFDVTFFEKAGYTIQGPIFDTRILAFAKWPFAKLKLKQLARDIFKKEVIELKNIRGRKKMEDIDPNILEGYVKQDIQLTYDLFKLLFQTRGHWVDTVEVPLTKTIYEIQKRGMLIDVKNLTEINHDWENDVSSVVGSYNINLNSSQQVKERLEQEVGPVKSTDKLSLIELCSKSKFARDMLQYRELQTLCSRYTRPFLKINKGGYIHGKFNQAGQEKNDTGVKTGRLSSSNPNLQNIPSRTPNGKALRKCFTAPRGHKLIVADASQIEPRFVAYYTRDPILLDIYHRGLDFHGRITEYAYGKSIFTPEERFVGKTIGLATIYGAYPAKLQAVLKQYGIVLSIGDVNILWNRIRDNFRHTIGWIKRFEEQTKQRGYFYTYGGRKYPYNPSSAVFNTLIQGGCADYNKLCVLNLEEIGYKVVNNIHDEILSYVPMSSAEKARKDFTEIMEQTISLGDIRVQADVKICDNWGEK